MVFNLFVCKLFSISEGLPGQPIKQVIQLEVKNKGIAQRFTSAVCVLCANVRTSLPVKLSS
jgi:hypothetical protein